MDICLRFFCAGRDPGTVLRKKKINFSSKRKRNNLNVKRCALIAIAAVLVIVVGFKGVNATTAFIEEKRQERIEMQKKAEAERLEEERKRNSPHLS